jgi:hypothetical protein
LIQGALRVGFSLPELATILKMRDRGEAPCHRVRAIAGQKLEEIKQQINDLLAMRDQLEKVVNDWDSRLARTSPGKPARLLESLPHNVIRSTPHRLTKNMKRGRK